MRISQHALDAIHALEQQVFKKTLSPSERIAALDVVQKAIDLGDKQNGDEKFWTNAFTGENLFQ